MGIFIGAISTGGNFLGGGAIFQAAIFLEPSEIYFKEKIVRLLLRNYENHIERIPIAVKNIAHFFSLASEITEDDRLHLFLLSDGTRIDDNP